MAVVPVISPAASAGTMHRSRRGRVRNQAATSCLADAVSAGPTLRSTVVWRPSVPNNPGCPIPPGRGSLVHPSGDFQPLAVGRWSATREPAAAVKWAAVEEQSTSAQSSASSHRRSVPAGHSPVSIPSRIASAGSCVTTNTSWKRRQLEYHPREERSKTLFHAAERPEQPLIGMKGGDTGRRGAGSRPMRNCQNILQISSLRCQTLVEAAFER
jgi:hypothetical protein